MRDTLFMYVFVMALTTYLIRMLPFALFTRKIRSRFIRSFLYYIPYAVLTAMTVPAIFYASSADGSFSAAAFAGFLAALLLSLRGKPLLAVAAAACAAAYIIESIF